MTNTAGTCQSCGMPMKRDPGGGGTEADGSRSLKYCSYCYRDGRFLSPDMTLDQMRVLVVEKLHEKGFPRFVGKFFAKGLPRLERWKA